ncbi:MAG: heavy metal translocating P-type ATPase [Lachnospiraceae bacterium]|nr:heavy metal translocating P-type ATPase [Lachnospiraceae bacterium]
MLCRILYDDDGRLRVHAVTGKVMSMREADVIEYHLMQIDGVRTVKVHERTGNIAIEYRHGRDRIIEALANYHGPTKELEEIVPVNNTRLINREYQEKMATMVMVRVCRRLFLPLPIRSVWTSVRAMRHMYRGIRSLSSLREGKLKVEFLDAVSIGVSLLRGDFRTASTVMFLLKIGELLEEWTRKKSISDLAQSMSLNIDRVWVKSGETEVQVPISQVREGDIVTVHQGTVIPLDGVINSGEVMVNQASMTGESMPVRKAVGMSVYAGTVLEDGECTVFVKNSVGAGRYDQIVHMIEASEKLKSATESKALNLADRLVPLSLAGTVLTYLFTRNVQKAVSVLMVDFCCALKLSMPIAVLSAMRECGDERILVKGGKYLEAMAEADTIVFDKTGTLTNATPTVAGVVPFNGMEEREVLRIAACLEEHFPHSMANAVVREAETRQVQHEEMHSEVEYIVAHGIASKIGNKRVIIGSHHFIFEDEHVEIRPSDREAYEKIPNSFSKLFLAIDGVLSGIICISDPLRSEVKEVVDQLRHLGFHNIVMMTGDSYKTAQSIAEEAGIDHFRAEVLPEDKAAFVKQEKAAGHKVVMLGDGINDSPALSEADVGIAIGDGAAIAREISDITIRAESLYELIYLKRVANALQRRIKSNYRFVMSFNSLLIVLGILGLISPSTSAMLHNLSTLGVGLQSMTDLLE